MIEIKELDYNLMKDKTYCVEIKSKQYLSIDTKDDGFHIEIKDSDTLLNKTIKDTILSDWLEDPIAYGAYDNEKLIGFVEGFLEKWNNRFRITNIIIFESKNRKLGIGKQLLDKILIEAKLSKARMVALETQSFNIDAINFYKKNGFEIIGFDLYAYSNDAIEDKNIRIEMGKKL